jgi:glutathione S-transferase
MILYGQLDSPFTRRVAVSLHHWGFDFEHRMISVFSDFKALRQTNPLGKVPALTPDDGATLFDSSFILDYLDELAGPERALTPPAGAARRESLRVTAIALGLAEKSVELRGETARRPEQFHFQPAIDRLESQIGTALDWLESHGGRPWLVGAKMTQADVTATVAMTYLAAKLPRLLPAGCYPELRDLQDRCEKMPAFTAAPFTDG